MRTIWQSFCISLVCTLFLSPLLTTIQKNRAFSPTTLFTSTAYAAPSSQLAPNETQSDELFLKELETIYLTNLERRKYGLSPLRWNRQLHLAARWFSADAVEGRSTSYCGHSDSQDRTPGQRFLAFGYLNAHAWGENVVCGNTDPVYAVQGWMNSEGHRANILHPDYREIGVGYFQQGSSGRGFITQDFSTDPKYAPIIINNEAPLTTEAAVELYIYDSAVGEGLQGMGPAVDMMIANNPDFVNATWQPFTNEQTWQLEEREGWHSVYVKRRDSQGRTTTVFDTIYLGESIPANELDLGQACGFRPRIALEALENTGWPQVQLSLNWLGNDEDSTFQDANGIGTRVSDPDAIGNSTYYLAAGNNRGNVRYWTTSFYKDVPLVAYFRIKAGNITTSNEVLQIKIDGGGTTYGPLTIKGTDFAVANTYYEFALPFQFNSNSDDPYLIFDMTHTGESDIYLDTISIFTESMPLQNDIEWQVLDGYYRSRGIWARFVNPNGSYTAPADLQVFGANTELVVPPTSSPQPQQPPIIEPVDPAYQLFIPITMR